MVTRFSFLETLERLCDKSSGNRNPFIGIALVSSDTRLKRVEDKRAE